MHSLAIFIFLYACESWPLTAELEKRTQAFEMKCYQRLVNILFKDRVSKPGRVAQSVGHLTRKSGVLGSIPGLATYFRFSFRFFMKGSCQLLAKVCARSTG